MTDKELQHLLPDYIEGRLDDATRSEIELRLETSADLRNALETAERYADAVAAIDPIRAPDDFLDKVHRRIEAGPGLVDRLFRPFHIKLPIELAGVAVTVVLVVLLYNPFSGKLPRQAVEREARQYTELQEPSAAIEAVPAIKDEIASSRSADERPASEVAEKKMLRRSIPGVRNSTDELRKETSAQYASGASDLSVKSAPRARASVRPAKESVYTQLQTATTPASQPEDGYNNQTAMAVSAVPAAPAVLRPSPATSKETSTDDVASVSAKEFEDKVDEGVSQPEAEGLRYSSKVRTEARTAPVRNTARRAAMAHEAASAPELTDIPASPDESAVNQITELVRRYQGTIETVPAERDNRIRLKLTIPSKKFGAFKKILSTDIKITSITDTISASGKSNLTIILEVKP